MRILINLFLNGLAVLIAAHFLPGVLVDNYLVAVIVAIVLGILNATLKPILLLLTLPINFLTLGLFTLVINAVVVLIPSYLVSGFKVEGFLNALLFSILLSVVSWGLNLFKS